VNRRALPQSSTWNFLFRRWFEAQDDTPVRVARGHKNGGAALPVGLVELGELKND
jgi:hypothetical protein